MHRGGPVPFPWSSPAAVGSRADSGAHQTGQLRHGASSWGWPHPLPPALTNTCEASLLENQVGNQQVLPLTGVHSIRKLSVSFFGGSLDCVSCGPTSSWKSSAPGRGEACPGPLVQVAIGRFRHASCREQWDASPSLPPFLPPSLIPGLT